MTNYLTLTSTLLFLLFSVFNTQAQNEPRLRIGVVGLTHDHVHGILGRPDKGDIEIVGLVESNRELAERLCKRYQLSTDLIYPTIEAMVAAKQPEAVSVFTDIYAHAEVVEYCAPLGIHVMVEKPMAVNMKHALRMEKAAKAGNIHLLTNYETTWYSSNHYANQLLNEEKALGTDRKIVVHDGHEGPREIGCSEEFLSWLTDPVLNGGGAITDFGCYGANLGTWLMQGQEPVSVSATTQQIKPDIYPNVDDEATIVVTYPEAQLIIQASWNWPMGRKDMHVYGKTGYVKTIDGSRLLVRKNQNEAEKEINQPKLSSPYNDAFSFFAQVIRGKIDSKGTLSSLEVNMGTMKILDAAVKSAKKGKTIYLKP